MRVLLSFFVMGWGAASVCAQVTQWTEGGEGGTAYIVDGTQSSYELLQTDLTAEGSYAFHLANPNFVPSWFAIDQTISVNSDTQLFFLSQLRAATPDQVAQVQLSTDGGNSWPNTIYTQPGNGFPGEGAFALRDVPLGSYAGQDVRLRFQLDFSTGSAFTGTDVASGWLIDDIQIGAELQKLQYSIGEPSPVEQEYLEFINRARADALLEANRLRYETTTSIQNAYDYFDIDPADIATHYQYYVDQDCIEQHAQPLSFSEELLWAADLHSQDMFANQFQEHVSSEDPPAPLEAGDTLADRLDRVGYAGAAAENVFAFADSAADGHAGFAVDWGNSYVPGRACYNSAFTGQGMQNPAGHRINIHNGRYKEAGIGVVEGTNGSVGPQVVTQNFGDPGDVAFITGVVFEDLNGNQFYDAGEGREGVRVDAEGSVYFAISSASGAYSIPVSEDGDYKVSFRGDGYSIHETTAQVMNGLNVKVDYLVQMATLSCDFTGDGLCDVDDLQSTAGLFSVGDLLVGVDSTDATSQFDLNGDLRIDRQDLEHWLAEAAEVAGYAESFLAGDTDLDGDVDFGDFLSLSAAFGGAGDWGNGNFDGNLTVEFADFLQLSGNFGTALKPAAETVPEAAWRTSCLLLLGLTLLRFRDHCGCHWA